jgi:tRNA U34 2-thiouridine synthase MnmA/TrmU
MSTEKRVIGVSLMSGGLDSTLAVRVLLEQGITVIGINFSGAYCPPPLEGVGNARRAADTLGIELVTLPIDRDFIEMVKRPKHGRGKHLNPCIDCHTLMIRKAWAYGQTRGAAFVATGEVLGQRPMSQNRQALETVARESGTEGRLLRPMSAKLLDPTVPEIEGLVDRSRLLDIEGRSRSRQMALAEQWGIEDYPTPAGGCLLTEDVYSRRLAAAFARGEDSLELIDLLRIGRHFRLPSGGRVVVGRDKVENDALLARRQPGWGVVDGTALPGPLALLIPDRAEDRATAALLVARYSDKRKQPSVTVMVDGEAVSVSPGGELEAKVE